MHKRLDLRIRDPFVVLYNGYYYMYNVKGSDSVFYYKSNDLNNWDECGVSFTIPKADSFWAYTDVWASEVHKYKNKYYIFVSLLGKDEKRGTQVAVSKTPAGPFIPVKNGPITPRDLSCIDATFFVHNDTPYILYSHDWPDCYNEEKDVFVGEIWAAEVDENLIDIVGEPFKLFASDDSPISKKTPDVWFDSIHNKNQKRYGSDAPFLQKLKNGKLFLTWSPYLNDNYVVLSAISENGDIRGPWKHSNIALFDNDGGHAMFFEDFSGRKIMSIHSPERYMLERAHFYHMIEAPDGFEIKEELPFN